MRNPALPPREPAAVKLQTVISPAEREDLRPGLDGAPPVTVSPAVPAETWFGAAGQMRVLDRPRTPDDALPAEWRGTSSTHPTRRRSRCRTEPPAASDLGEPGARSTPCLPVGTPSLSSLVRRSGGCVEDLEASGGVQFMGIDPDVEGTGAPGAVVSASDGVRSVAVMAGNMRLKARVSNNGFFVELPSSSCSMTAVEFVLVTNHDGTRTDIPVDWDRHAPGQSVCRQRSGLSSSALGARTLSSCSRADYRPYNRPEPAAAERLFDPRGGQGQHV